MGIVQGQSHFLKGLRRLCDEHHIVLIFDEVITGFRVSYNSCPQYLGIVPDMVCFGKIIGGGLPVGAYGRKKRNHAVDFSIGTYLSGWNAFW